MVTILIKNFKTTNKLNYFANISNIKYVLMVLKVILAKHTILCREEIVLLLIK